MSQLALALRVQRQSTTHRLPTTTDWRATWLIALAVLRKICVFLIPKVIDAGEMAKLRAYLFIATRFLIVYEAEADLTDCQPL